MRREKRMKSLKEAAVGLLKVKSIITILMTITFVYLSVTNQITQDFMVEYSVIIAFYFGTQSQKDDATGAISRKDEQ